MCVQWYNLLQGQWHYSAFFGYFNKNKSSKQWQNWHQYITMSKIFWLIHENTREVTLGHGIHYEHYLQYEFSLEDCKPTKPTWIQGSDQLYPHWQTWIHAWIITEMFQNRHALKSQLQKFMNYVLNINTQRIPPPLTCTLLLGELLTSGSIIHSLWCTNTKKNT